MLRIGTAARPSEIFRSRMREVRRRRGWTQAQLAERLTAAGYPMSRAKIGKLEAALKVGIDVDDVVAISAVLGVSPLHMLVPRGDEESVSLTPAHVVDAPFVRQWIRGDNPLMTAPWAGPDDLQVYATEIADSEMQQAFNTARTVSDRWREEAPALLARLAALVDHPALREDQREEARSLSAFLQAILTNDEFPLPLSAHAVTHEKQP